MRNNEGEIAMTKETQVHKAVEWIMAQLKTNPRETRKFELLDEAAQRFNLSPRESEILAQTVKDYLK